MENIKGFPWGVVLANFVWIMGASLILADFSFHEFLGHVERIKRTEVFKRRSFIRPLLWGLILVCGGVSLSVHWLWLSIVMGLVTVFLIILTFKKF